MRNDLKYKNIMFSRDNPMIGKYADQGPIQTVMAVLFVIASIRTFTWLLPDMLDNYRDKGMKAFNNLMPLQREGMRFVIKNSTWLYNLVQSRRAGDIYPEEFLISLQRIPCIGLVKAGSVSYTHLTLPTIYSV